MTGSLQAVSRAAVAAQESGRIESVHVDEDDFVRSGDLLVSLDARRMAAQLEGARAEYANVQAIVAQREAELAFARLDRERMAGAYEQRAANSIEI